MRVLVTGAGGKLGYDLIRVLSRHYEVVAATRDELDVTDAGAVKNTLRHVLPEIVIHAAAYTSVDLAEDEVDQAYQVNAIGNGMSQQKLMSLEPNWFISVRIMYSME
jgi:dTDP-4-dehydrorhamnose reductase